jgi:hypothetical protein
MPPKFDPTEIKIRTSLWRRLLQLLALLRALPRVQWQSHFVLPWSYRLSLFFFFLSYAPVKMRSIGGEAAGASSLAPKVGPLGLVRRRAHCAATCACEKFPENLRLVRC